MRQVHRATADGFIIAMFALLTGCTGTACSGRDISPPGVNLDTRSWLNAHPGASLIGCIDDANCVSLASSRQLVSKKSIGETTQFSLRVTGTKDGRTILALNQKVQIPVTSSSPGPCGTIRTQEIDLVLDDDGRISTARPG